MKTLIALMCMVMVASSCSTVRIVHSEKTIEALRVRAQLSGTWRVVGASVGNEDRTDLFGGREFTFMRDGWRCELRDPGSRDTTAIYAVDNPNLRFISIHESINDGDSITEEVSLFRIDRLEKTEMTLTSLKLDVRVFRGSEEAMSVPFDKPVSYTLRRIR